MNANEVDLSQLWVASFSVVQGYFDTCTLAEACQIHVNEILGNYDNRYLVFAVCDSQEAALEACERMATTMVERGGSVDDLGRVWLPEAVPAGSPH